MKNVDCFVIGVGIVGVLFVVLFVGQVSVVVLEVEFYVGYYFMGCFVVLYLVFYGNVMICVLMWVSLGDFLVLL